MVVRLFLVPRMVVVMGLGCIGLVAVVVSGLAAGMIVFVNMLELVGMVVLMTVTVGVLLLAVFVRVLVVMLVGVVVLVFVLVLAVGHGQSPFRGLGVL